MKLFQQPVFKMLGLFLIAGLISTALAVPLTLGITLGSGSNALPTLTLPYGTYKAYSYDTSDDVCLDFHWNSFTS